MLAWMLRRRRGGPWKWKWILYSQGALREQEVLTLGATRTEEDEGGEEGSWRKGMARRRTGDVRQCSTSG